ncbi:MAG: hypothetical protein ABI851_16110, partial [Saprospiraceae bacterium]
MSQPSSTTTSSSIVSKVWAFCITLGDDESNPEGRGRKFGDITLPGITIANPLFLLNVFKSSGKFDYRFYQFDRKPGTAAIGYLDNETGSTAARGKALTEIFILNGEQHKDKIALSTE